MWNLCTHWIQSDSICQMHTVLLILFSFWENDFNLKVQKNLNYSYHLFTQPFLLMHQYIMVILNTEILNLIFHHLLWNTLSQKTIESLTVVTPSLTWLTLLLVVQYCQIRQIGQRWWFLPEIAHTKSQLTSNNGKKLFTFSYTLCGIKTD